ncbi:hypothetical protein GGTG_04277 [Gaeumannomyces tritici R3-111a-1]|uniref:Uncharacterized protein n=1 Tax=Gaeumannomyces tritici (strain R3-111a-1) TaxID=644352 RepID=J3NSM6_GAET3|nr:hypothetical protein GGTG_04277 [Gaeumannomyces tritici R3-111a-1]EJT79189.1 hypothetical protein GGTG_04277 [Gaeumannomyces tritici R3-111a-1]
MVLHFTALPFDIRVSRVAPAPGVEGWKWLWLCGWSLSTLFNMVFLFQWVLKHSLLITPWARYSSRFFQWRRVVVGNLMLLLCLLLIIGEYVVVPAVLCSRVMLDDTFSKVHLAGFVILASPTICFSLWIVLIVLQALFSTLSGIFVTLMGLQLEARLVGA